VWDKLLTDIRNQKSVLMKTSDDRSQEVEITINKYMDFSVVKSN